MNHDLADAPAVLSGTWLYAGDTPCAVKIVSHHVLYGTGDHEDPPEIADDQEVECFYIYFSTPAGQPQWVGGGASTSLTEARTIVEQKLGSTLTWHEKDSGTR
ncbi:hypothetical protein HLB44_36655 [Aquincola sp. S2]|uniref:Uncharacterized protein n=2 Tax=Pseudaquabacterium terrae TaxID=2732868 RepID=A0ABX2EVL6_9BURK|nr:hypothetical protein [Aquabacterium terrae]